MKKILLCGYMASGKTTIGRLLATATGFPFIDLDAFIEQKAGKTITELFAQHGEIYFRKLEHSCLKEIMEGEGQEFVLALGGGTPCYAGNHVYLQQHDVASFYLQVPLPVLVQRLETEKASRPVLAQMDAAALAEFTAIHVFERSYFYTQATYTIHTGNTTPEQTVNQVMSLL